MERVDVKGILDQNAAGHKPPLVSVAEFHDLPRELGWKYELIQGQIQKSPSPYAVATLRLGLGPRAEDPRWAVRPLSAADRPGLVRLFYLAFVNSVEYHGCPRPFVRKRAEDSVAAFFEQKEQPWFAAARLIADGPRIAAAALVRKWTRGPILEPLMVRPSHQRQGLATALMAPIVQHLLALGATELFSQCHLANEASLGWHRRFGFEELADEWVAVHRAGYCRYEFERRDRLGDFTDQERQEWTAQTLHWESEAKRLQNEHAAGLPRTLPQLE